MHIAHRLAKFNCKSQFEAASQQQWHFLCVFGEFLIIKPNQSMAFRFCCAIFALELADIVHQTAAHGARTGEQPFRIIPRKWIFGSWKIHWNIHSSLNFDILSPNAHKGNSWWMSQKLSASYLFPLRIPVLVCFNALCGDANGRNELRITWTMNSVWSSAFHCGCEQPLNALRKNK